MDYGAQKGACLGRSGTGDPHNVSVGHLPVLMCCVSPTCVYMRSVQRHVVRATQGVSWTLSLRNIGHVAQLAEGPRPMPRGGCGAVWHRHASPPHSHSQRPTGQRCQRVGY
ncbi:hypothetical protein AALO_G00186630 [Alosa alosa]|uniref:Uncharacterized protein n=1 Tax=Alosa alosa TaxID=278164 RepID=A0AAV6GB50_9TELE|nr:hypothetical protein AALO_G00186630 [Alosa alosa]